MRKKFYPVLGGEGEGDRAKGFGLIIFVASAR